MGQLPHSPDPAAELVAALDGVALGDGSRLARLLATGPDYLDLLHRLSTGDVARLEPGRGRSTVLTTPKGRIVERLFVHHLGERGVLSVGGASAGPRVLEHMARFTFAENTGLADTTGSSFQFLLVGPEAGAVLDAVALPRPETLCSSYGSLADTSVNVLGHDGLSSGGFSVVGSADSATSVWDALLAAVESAGGRSAGDHALETRRVLLGLPASGHELTEEHNPLEAGLRDAVSFDKGCYVGQEVVARLRTYDKVARSLVGLELPAGTELPAMGTPLFDEDRPVGDLTSAVLPPGRDAAIGLGYVKRVALRPHMQLRVGQDGNAIARVVDLPFCR